MKKDNVNTPETQETAAEAAQVDESTQPAETVSETEENNEKSKKNSKKKADKKVTELEEKLAAAEKENAELKEMLLRKAAEFDNYRKRTEKEKLAANGNGVATAVEKMLLVIDTLERAAEAASTDEVYKKGVLLTVTQFKSCFDSLGVKEMDVLDKPFDPNFHTAIAQMASDKESGTVISVMQKGYMLGDRVIRPAMVAVAE